MIVIKVYGAPGTGKTTWMLTQLENEIKNGVPLKRIAFVTHSVAARDEARVRAKKLLPEATDQDFQYFRTIHGICYGQMGLSKFNVMQPDDYMAFGDTACLPFSTDFTTELDEDGLPLGWVHSPGNELLAVRQYAAAWMLDPFHPQIMSEWPDKVSPGELKWLLTKYDVWKAQHTKFDFVDMLQVYLTEQGSPLDVDVVFVDEAQDLSRLQWAVVHKMWANAKFGYIAGDDDQSIYGFIGADPLGFLHHPADKEIILPRSFRVKGNVWDYAQRIIAGVSERRAKRVFVEDGGRIHYWGLDPSYLTLKFGQEVMMIARHHAQLTGIARDLHNRGIPCWHRGRKITGTSRADAVVSYLHSRAGIQLWLNDAANLLKHLGRKEDARRMREEARQYPERMVDPSQIKHDFSIPWMRAFSGSRYNAYEHEVLERVMGNYGINAIKESPKITLTTYHASKGREAEHVVLFTDCYRSAYEHAQRNPDDELRLSYVGITRAKQELTIITPQTDTFMRALA